MIEKGTAMMKTMKVLKIFSGLLGVLVLAIILTVLFWLGPTVKMVAQTIGAKALGVPVEIERLSINPRKGIIHLSDLSVENPDLFGQSNAVSIASMDMAIDMGSIFTKTVVVHQVQINSPHFTYEQSPATDNISEFIASIQSFADIDPSAPPEKTKPKKNKSKQKEPKKIIVESLQINDVQVLLANTHDSKLDIGAGFGRFSASMTNGMVRLDNVYVSNPGRLTSPNLFTLDEVEILMEPGSIYSSNVVIDAVNIGNPRLFVEQTADTDTFAELLKIATLLAGKDSDQPAARHNRATIARGIRTGVPGRPAPDGYPEILPAGRPAAQHRRRRGSGAECPPANGPPVACPGNRQPGSDEPIPNESEKTAIPHPACARHAFRADRTRKPRRRHLGREGHHAPQTLRHP
jgi:hypothetical protein